MEATAKAQADNDCRRWLNGGEAGAVGRKDAVNWLRNDFSVSEV